MPVFQSGGAIGVEFLGMLPMAVVSEPVNMQQPTFDIVFSPVSQLPDFVNNLLMLVWKVHRCTSSCDMTTWKQARKAVRL